MIVLHLCYQTNHIFPLQMLSGRGYIQETMCESFSGDLQLRHLLWSKAMYIHLKYPVINSIMLLT